MKKATSQKTSQETPQGEVAQSGTDIGETEFKKIYDLIGDIFRDVKREDRRDLKLRAALEKVLIEQGIGDYRVAQVKIERRDPDECYFYVTGSDGGVQFGWKCYPDG